MKKQKLFMVCVCVSLLLFISYPSYGQSVSSPGDVKIGVILPLSGPVASIGAACQRGVVLAAEKINKDGGIKSLKGAKIKLIFGDDEAKPDVVLTEGEKLMTREKVDALIGAYTSSCTFPLTQLAERYKVPIIVPASAKDDITERGFKYTFRLVGKASYIAKEQLDFIKWLSEKTNVPINTLGLLYEDSGWGQSHAKNLKELIPKAGYKIGADIAYSKDTKDVRSEILKLKAANPEFIIQESYTADAILISKMLNELRFDCKGIVGTGTGHSDFVWLKGVGDLSEYMMQWEGWSSSIPLEEVRKTVKEFQTRFNAMPAAFESYFFTSTYALADAFELASSVDKEKVKNSFSKVRIKVGEKGNLMAFPATFDENGQAPAIGVFTQIQKGKYEVIYPEAIQSAKPIFPIPPWAKRK